jgi:WD40 repeat protein/transcriptional regulator with XRE-family HTH domain
VAEGGPLGQRLAILRLNAGLTQEQLARAAGVSVETIGDIERGTALKPRAQTLRRIADALGLAEPAWAELLGLAAGSGSTEPAQAPRRGQRQAGHAFISYVREDSYRIDQLQQALEAAGIPVWRDTDDLWPGEDWRAKIRQAITDDALVFIACYSRASLSRRRSYQNEELVLAIEQLRQRRPDDPWLIPVRLDVCEIPDLDLGGGRRLASIQRADLFGDRYGQELAKLIAAVSRILGRETGTTAGPWVSAPAVVAKSPRSPGASRAATVSAPEAQPTSGVPRRPNWRRRLFALLGAVVVIALALGAAWIGLSTGNPRSPSAACFGGRSPAPRLRGPVRTFATGPVSLQDFVGVAFVPDSAKLATGGGCGTLQLWDLVTGRRSVLRPVLKPSSVSTVFGLAVTPDGKILAAAAAGSNREAPIGVTVLWNIAAHRQIHVLQSTPGGATYSASISMSSPTLATLGSDGVARLWNPTTGKEIGQRIPTGSGAGSLAISPDDKVLAVGGTDGKIRLYDVASHKLLRPVLLSADGNVFSVAFSPNSKILVVATNAGMQWWNVADRKQIPIRGSSGAVGSLAFSPNGQLLAAGGNGVVELWDTITRQRVYTLPVAPADNSFRSRPNGLAFSRNNTLLAVGLPGFAELWNVSRFTRTSG